MERRALRCLKGWMLFDFLDFRIGRWDVLPDFVGMLLLYAFLEMQEERTQAEARIRPLFLLLAADYFVHWAWQFENGLEGLLAMVVYLYAVFVLLGEVAGRVRPWQPDQAGKLDLVRKAVVLTQLTAFLASPFENQLLNITLVFVMVGVWATSLVVIAGIRPWEA